MILVIDAGTTGVTCLVVDDELRTLGRGYREIRQFFPRPGWVEHDPDDIWQSTLGAAEEALAQARVAATDLAGIGIANQRETTLVWERDSGTPLQRAIVWQDRRTADAAGSSPPTCPRARPASSPIRTSRRRSSNGSFVARTSSRRRSPSERWTAGSSGS